MRSWCREAKYFLHHIQLLASLKPAPFGRMEESLSELVDALGEDHDLTVLNETLRAHVAPFADADDLAILDRLTRKEQKRLWREALKTGEKGFREKEGKIATGVTSIHPGDD